MKTIKQPYFSILSSLILWLDSTLLSSKISPLAAFFGWQEGGGAAAHWTLYRMYTIAPISQYGDNVPWRPLHHHCNEWEVLNTSPASPNYIQYPSSILGAYKAYLSIFLNVPPVQNWKWLWHEKKRLEQCGWWWWCDLANEIKQFVSISALNWNSRCMVAVGTAFVVLYAGNPILHNYSMHNMLCIFLKGTVSSWDIYPPILFLSL